MSDLDQFVKAGIAKGHMSFSMFGRTAKYLGGPYRNRPANLRGVKMAQEIKAPYTFNVPTPDFQTPPKTPMQMALVQSFALGLRDGKPTYVGCMAGQGRTGLFMATLAYLTGSDDPVTKVRAEYYPHAVETDEQAAYVTQAFNRDQFRREVMIAIYDAIDFRWFWQMPWRDKLLYLRTAFHIA